MTQHTRGPVHTAFGDGYGEADIRVSGDQTALFRSPHIIARCHLPERLDKTYDILQAEANARLFAAAYNAFDSSAAKLELNTIEFAENLCDGGIAQLLTSLEECVDEIAAWRRWAKPGEGPEKPILTTTVLHNARGTIAKARGK